MPKLDPELMRQILIAAEQYPPEITIGEIEVEGHDPLMVSYHIKMLDEAGLVTGMDISTFGGLHWWVKSLTYNGHRLLDGIRNESAWANVKAEAKKRSLDVTIEVIKALVVKALAAAIQ